MFPNTLGVACGSENRIFAVNVDAINSTQAIIITIARADTSFFFAFIKSNSLCLYFHLGIHPVTIIKQYEIIISQFLLECNLFFENSENFKKIQIRY